MGSRRSPPSLVALLEAVEGHKLLFELHNDATISGRLASVDEQMKCVFLFDVGRMSCRARTSSNTLSLHTGLKLSTACALTTRCGRRRR